VTDMNFVSLNEQFIAVVLYFVFLLHSLITLIQCHFVYAIYKVKY